MTTSSTIANKAERLKAWYSRQFLGEFRKPKTGPRFSYHEELAEKTAVTIQRLMQEGLLQPCELPDLVAEALSADELRQLLAAHNCPAGTSVGKKKLVERALELAGAELESKYAGMCLYRCTEAGLRLVNGFEEEKTAAEKAGKERSFKFLEQGDITGAWNEYVRFTRSFFRPDFIPSFHGAQPKIILHCTPPPLRRLQPDDLHPLRILAALGEIWDDVDARDWLSSDLQARLGNYKRALGLIYANAVFHEALAKLNPQDLVKLTIGQRSGSNLDADLCEACHEMDGKILQAKDVPEFPLEGCSSNTGCWPLLERIKQPASSAEILIAPNPPSIPGQSVTDLRQPDVPLWTRTEWSQYLSQCRDVIRKLISEKHVDFDQQPLASKRTIVNKIIKDHFRWAMHGNEALLVIDEPAPIDYSTFAHFKVPTALIDTYLYHRAGFGLRSAIWVAPQSSLGHPHLVFDTPGAFSGGWANAPR